MTDHNTSLPSEIEYPQIKRKLWGPWATLGFGLVVGIVYLVTQSFVVVIFAVAKFISDSTISPLQLVETLISDGMLISLATFASAIVCVGLILVIIKVRRGATIAEYLGLKVITGKTILVLLAISAGLIILSSGLSWIVGKPLSDYMVDIYRTSIWPALFWIAVVIFAPVFEEFFFRGFLFVGLRQSRIGIAGTVVLTALTWALLHIQYGAYEIATIFVMGIVLGIVRFKTNSLWSPLIMHAFFNMVATLEIALYINNSIS